MTSPPPRWATERDPHARTFGPAVGRLAAALGTPLMPWQRQVAHTALEVDDEGRYRYPTVLVTVPRQSGKTTLLQAVMAHRCLTVPDASVWLTAQKRNDARDAWMTTAKRLGRSPLAPLLATRRTNGSEGIAFPAGSELRVFAPAEDSLHGKTTDLVFVDEVWAFAAEAGRQLMQAIVPTQATRPGAQIWMVSTAGTSASTWMRPMVDAARAGRADGVAYFEWSIPEDTTDLADLEVYAAHHPALGHTISRRSLEQAQDILDVGEFARAYGNFWVTSDAFFIAPSIWEAARTREPLAPRSALALGVEVAPDRSSAVIVAAGHLPGGQVALEVVEHRGGVGWLAPRVLELARRHRPAAVVIDPYGPARAVGEQLAAERRARVPLVEHFSAADFIAASTGLVDGLAEGSVRHRSHRLLDGALAVAGTRQVRDQTVLARAGTGSGEHPTALVAGMLAAWGLARPPAAAPRPAIYSAPPPDQAHDAL